MDGEDHVREALRRAAAQIEPATDGWERFEDARRSRRRRDRVVGVLSAVVAVALVGATLATVLPGGERTELVTPPPPTPSDAAAVSPAVTETPTAEPPAPGVAVEPAPMSHVAVLATAGGGQVVAGLPPAAAEVDELAERSPELVCTQDCASEVLVVRPGSRAGEVTAVRSMEGRCVVEVERDVVAEVEGSCHTPVWSPDGGALAWLDRSGAEPVVQVAAWNSQTRALEPMLFPASPARVTGVEGLQVLKLQAWSFVGFAKRQELLLVVRDAQGHRMRASATVGPAVSGDGPLALTLPEADEPGQVMATDDDGGTWVRVLADGDVELVVPAATGAQGSDGSNLVVLPLPPELVDPRADGPSNIWVSVAGDDLLVGDGVDQVWWTHRTSDGWAQPQELLPGQFAVTAGDLALPGPDGTAPPVPSRSPAAAAAPRQAEVGVFFGVEGPTCDHTVRLPRTVASPAVARGALEALLAGPTSPEAQRTGAVSPLAFQPPGILRSIHIESGTAYVDFGPLRATAEGGETTACGSTQMLASLDATLTQFPTVDRTRYAINGSEEAFYAFAGDRVPPP